MGRVDECPQEPGGSRLGGALLAVEHEQRVAADGSSATTVQASSSAQRSSGTLMKDRSSSTVPPRSGSASGCMMPVRRNLTGVSTDDAPSGRTDLDRAPGGVAEVDVQPRRRRFRPRGP